MNGCLRWEEEIQSSGCSCATTAGPLLAGLVAIRRQTEGWGTAAHAAMATVPRQREKVTAKVGNDKDKSKRTHAVRAPKVTSWADSCGFR